MEGNSSRSEHDKIDFAFALKSGIAVVVGWIDNVIMHFTAWCTYEFFEFVHGTAASIDFYSIRIARCFLGTKSADVWCWYCIIVCDTLPVAYRLWKLSQWPVNLSVFVIEGMSVACILCYKVCCELHTGMCMADTHCWVFDKTVNFLCVTG